MLGSFLKRDSANLSVSRVPPPSFTLTKWIDLVSVFASLRNTLLHRRPTFYSIFPTFHSILRTLPSLYFCTTISTSHCITGVPISSSILVAESAPLMRASERTNCSVPSVFLATGFDVRNYSVSRSSKRQALETFNRERSYRCRPPWALARGNFSA